jgi:hypothetical protein
MKKKKKINLNKLSDNPTKKLKSDEPDERHPNPDDPYEETGPPIKEMPAKSKPNREEILN